MGSKRDIVFLDPINKGYSHVYFNASILSLFKAVPGKTILIGDRGQVRNVLTLAKADNIAPSFISVKSALKRKVLALFLTLLKSVFRSKDICFLSFDNTIVPLFLITFRPLLFRSRLTLIVHNNLDTLLKNPLKRRLHRIALSLYNGRSIVLTKKMYEIYSDLFPQIRCAFLPHPNYIGLIKFSYKRNLVNTGTINILLLGRQAKLLTSVLPKLNLERHKNITFITSLSSENYPLHIPNVKFLPRKPDFDEYYTLLREADFVLFANDDDLANRASGILIDCISLSCPIIGPAKGHFLEFGSEFGFLYDSYSSLRGVLEKINDGKIKREMYVHKFSNAISQTDPRKWQNIFSRS